MPTSLLLVEDDPCLRHDLDRHFLNRGFRVQACACAEQALGAIAQAPFDLVLLDIMLPGIDGLTLLDALRHRQAVPVMLMSALGAEQDRITGFTRGADDYLPKPFSLAELDARVDALLRRAAFARQPARLATLGDLLLDQDRQDALNGGKPAGLTPSEFRLLVTLQAHAGEPLSKPFLYQTVLHRAYTRLDRGLDVHVCNLRRKLADIDVQHVQIQAVRGQGYVLVDQEQA